MKEVDSRLQLSVTSPHHGWLRFGKGLANRVSKERGDSWYYYFRLNGARYRKAIPEARTKYQAQQAEAAARDSIFEGKYDRRSSSTTFQDFVESAFLPWAKDNKRSWRNDSQEPNR